MQSILGNIFQEMLVLNLNSTYAVIFLHPLWIRKCLGEHSTSKLKNLEQSRVSKRGGDLSMSGQRPDIVAAVHVCNQLVQQANSKYASFSALHTPIKTKLVANKSDSRNCL